MLDIKKLLTKILDSFKTQTDTLNGSYGLVAYVCKCCGVVSITINQTSATQLPKGQWITIGTLSASFRPVFQVDALGPDNNTSSVQNNSVQLRVTTGGNVNVWAYTNGVTNNQVLATVTYIGGGTP